MTPLFIPIDRSKRCVLERHGECRGVLQAHHLVQQQHIRKRWPRGAWEFGGELKPVLKRSALWSLKPDVSLDDLLADRRNLVAICDEHHQAVTNARLYLVPDELAWEFARSVGLESVLERQLERAA